MQIIPMVFFEVKGHLRSIIGDCPNIVITLWVKVGLNFWIGKYQSKLPHPYRYFWTLIQNIGKSFVQSSSSYIGKESLSLLTFWSCLNVMFTYFFFLLQLTVLRPFQNVLKCYAFYWVVKVMLETTQIECHCTHFESTDTMGVIQLATNVHTRPIAGANPFFTVQDDSNARFYEWISI